MKWFNNLKIRRKLFLGFGVLISLMIILIIYSASQFIGVNRTFSNLTESTSRRQTELTNAMEILALLRINNISTAYLINSDDAISHSLFLLSHGEYERLCNVFLGHLSNYQGYAINDTSLTGIFLQERLNLVNEVANLFIEDFEPCFYLIRNGVDRNDPHMVSEGLQEAYYSATVISGRLNDLRELLVDLIEDETQRISAYSQGIIYTQILVAIFILAFAVTVSLFMSKAIERPVQELSIAATKIAGGDLAYPIRNDSKNEIGVLSNYIGDMVDSMKRANQAKSDFLANMSHEMRTPLNVVTGLTALRMDEKDLSDEMQDDLRKINSAGEILLGLVNDVLDISKVEAGKLELLPVDYHMASLLNDIITLNMIRIESKPINFIIDISESLPSELHGDDLRIKQIFNNLLSNAFKYTREGTVTLRVHCVQDNGHATLSITVKDTGIGIRQEDMNKLFSVYNQVDTRANRAIEGTGLGLTITKKFIELMDGTITVESEYGKGTSFLVTIRQRIINEQPLGHDVVENLRHFHYTDQKQNAFAGLVRANLSGARVLVVDDFPTNLDVAAGMLRKYKLQVDCVTNGQAAIDLVKQGDPQYDAIFMDHMMPEMDGIEAVRLIRGLDSSYAQTVPIISLTANALVGNEQMFLDQGFDAFLPKPINMLKLDAIVKKWVRNSKVNQQNIDDPAAVLAEKSAASREIPGINMEAALDLYSNDREIFAFTLESFVNHTPDEIKAMYEVSEENLPQYAIAVHGLKSTSAAIGAGELSEKAKNLEFMAKNGDLEGVRANNDELLALTRTMLKDIKAWLHEVNNEIM